MSSAIVWVATREALQGNLNPGQFVVLMTAMMGIIPSLRRITNVQSVIGRGVAAAERLFAVLDDVEEVDAGQVPLARAVKSVVKIPVVAVGLITDPLHAEAIIGNGDADLVALARTVLYDPRWPWHAAATLGAQVKAANQYLRCQPSLYKELFQSPR